MKKKNRKKHKIIKLVIVILIIIILLVPVIIKQSISIPKTTSMFLASNTNELTIYEENEEKNLSLSKIVIRGTKVTTKNKIQSIEDEEYYIVNMDNNKYYVKKDNLVNNEKEIVLEDKIYVRTPTTIITDTSTGQIGGLANKTNELEVLGFDSIDEEGHVLTYHIKLDDIEGYVYGKYMSYNYEESTKNYNSEVYDNIFSQVTNPYNGGDAIELDYYPTDKQEFKDNVMPSSVYALYLNSGSNVINNIDAYIEFAKGTNINTFVVDVKDNETPAYPAKVFESLSKTNYDHAINSYDDYKNAITKIKEAGFYVVGRITTFKDTYYVTDHPEDAISSINTGSPYLHTGSYWPSPYDRDVWYYEVSLAKEAVKEFGFNEINFDYVRFPDRMQGVESIVDLHNEYNEDKTQAIQRFVQYACDELHKLNVYVSIDVFGETTNQTYTTAYGQYWPSISNVADVISGMPYPDHFSNGYYGIDKPWNNPYKLIYTWSTYAKDRQNETPTPAKVRTWIQAYDVLKYVDPSGINYNSKELESEIRGLYEGGLTDGYITWLSNSNLDKYKSQADAFKIDYEKEYTQ